MQTDFPDPVVPAIKRCGIETKSPTIGNPEILFPRVIGILISLLLNSLLEIISFKATFSLTLFGISIPMVLLPGTVATLVDIELVLRAMSSERFIIFDVLIPAVGSNSYKVTTGPALTLFISPEMLKSKRTFSRNFD
jgi:hypothetical protein